jgi:hypothetical protein
MTIWIMISKYNYENSLRLVNWVKPSRGMKMSYPATKQWGIGKSNVTPEAAGN